MVLADGRVEKMSGGHADASACMKAGGLAKLSPAQELWVEMRTPKAAGVAPAGEALLPPAPAETELVVPRVTGSDGGETDAAEGMVVSWFGSLGVIGSDLQMLFENGERIAIDNARNTWVLDSLAADEEAVVARIRAQMAPTKAVKPAKEPKAAPGGAKVHHCGPPPWEKGRRKVVDKAAESVARSQPLPVKSLAEVASGFATPVPGSAQQAQEFGRQPVGWVENVVKPSVYDIIRAYGLDFFVGSALEQLLAGNGRESLRAARAYLGEALGEEA